jgi:hypothetical protein
MTDEKDWRVAGLAFQKHKMDELLMNLIEKGVSREAGPDFKPKDSYYEGAQEHKQLKKPVKKRPEMTDFDMKVQDEQRVEDRVDAEMNKSFDKYIEKADGWKKFWIRDREGGKKLYAYNRETEELFEIPGGGTGQREIKGQEAQIILNHLNEVNPNNPAVRQQQPAGYHVVGRAKPSTISEKMSTPRAKEFYSGGGSPPKGRENVGAWQQEEWKRMKERYPNENVMKNIDALIARSKENKDKKFKSGKIEVAGKKEDVEKAVEQPHSKGPVENILGGILQIGESTLPYAKKKLQERSAAKQKARQPSPQNAIRSPEPSAPVVNKPKTANYDSYGVGTQGQQVPFMTAQAMNPQGNPRQMFGVGQPNKVEQAQNAATAANVLNAPSFGKAWEEYLVKKQYEPKPEMDIEEDPEEIPEYTYEVLSGEKVKEFPKEEVDPYEAKRLGANRKRQSGEAIEQKRQRLLNNLNVDIPDHGGQSEEDLLLLRNAMRRATNRVPVEATDNKLLAQRKKRQEAQLNEMRNDLGESMVEETKKSKTIYGFAPAEELPETESPPPTFFRTIEPVKKKGKA